MSRYSRCLQLEFRFTRLPTTKSCLHGIQLSLQRPNDLANVIVGIGIGGAVRKVSYQPQILYRSIDPLIGKAHEFCAFFCSHESNVEFFIACINYKSNRFVKYTGNTLLYLNKYVYIQIVIHILTAEKIAAMKYLRRRVSPTRPGVVNPLSAAYETTHTVAPHR